MSVQKLDGVIVLVHFASYENVEEVDIECLNSPERGGCWSQLNSVQSSEQPVNPSIISSPLYEGSIKY